MASPVEPRVRMQADIEALCRYPRESASPGEREAAEWVASEFRAAGLATEVEPFDFYPAYWNVSAAHALAALASWLLLARGGRRRRLLAASASAFVTASYWGDASARFYWLRRLFPARPSVNVLARLPNPHAKRLLVVSGHVDAAHPGLVFHPGLLRRLWNRNPEGQIRPALTLPFRGLVALTAACALRALGLPRALARLVALPGVFVSVVTTALMADIGRRPVVPGANDDASGVAAVLALARDLAVAPPPNLEVWFLATGCEEAFEGGIHAFLRRHGAEVRDRRPFFLNIEMLGSGTPTFQQAEGHITTFHMHPEAISLLSRVAAEREFAGVQGMVSPAQSDALGPHHSGFPAVTVASLPPAGQVPYYHWPNDTPDHIDGASLDRCYRYLRRVIERLDEGEEKA